MQMGASVPVSYTHLDVYKRQVVESWFGTYTGVRSVVEWWFRYLYWGAASSRMVVSVSILACG